MAPPLAGIRNKRSNIFYSIIDGLLLTMNVKSGATAWSVPDWFRKTEAKLMQLRLNQISVS
jgi:hypothetical protein